MLCSNYNEDKSYKNRELSRGYRENDILGGHDPYSASKACAEIIIQCYLNSCKKKKKNLRVSIARAGNVIGGGDWSKDSNTRLYKIDYFKTEVKYKISNQALAVCFRTTLWLYAFSNSPKNKN